MKFLSLFSGIGGLDLGLERAGMTCIGQVEIDSFCRRVLAKHWPDVPRHDDVRTFTKANWNGEQPDLVCGGFPCQDISNAGKRAGINGERSGLWSEFHRIICEFRPRYVLMENVAALLERGIERVVGDLAACRYDSEWECLPAFAFGAPHLRDRLFIVAYPQCGGLEGRIFRREKPPTIKPSAHRRTSLGTQVGAAWGDEPQISLLDDGATGRLAEFFSRGTGNAVVPQVAEWIGRRIMEASK